MSKNQQAFIIPFLAKIHQALRPYAYPFLRIFIGLIFVAHGWGKFQEAFFGPGLEGLASGYIEPSGLPFPLVLAWLTMISEFFGGICIALGLFTRMWAFFAMIMMYSIVFFIKGVDPFFTYKGGMEYDLVLAVIFSVIAVRGAGAFSLDSKMKKVF